MKQKQVYLYRIFFLNLSILYMLPKFWHLNSKHLVYFIYIYIYIHIFQFYILIHFNFVIYEITRENFLYRKLCIWSLNHLIIIVVRNIYIYMLYFHNFLWKETLKVKSLFCILNIAIRVFITHISTTRLNYDFWNRVDIILMYGAPHLSVKSM